jgi:hypothetical protein
MPSRAEMRIRVEQVLRGIVIAVLAVMLWESLHQRTDSGGQFVTARGISGSALAKWSSLATAPAKIQVKLDSVPSMIERAWLGALAGAGSSVTWTGDLAPVMIDAQPVASPAGGTKVIVAAPSGSSVVVGDDVGPIDTVHVQNGGAALTLNSVADHFTARAKGSIALTSAHDSIVLRRVLVIGEASWEAKFVVAALEEEGWKVDAFIRVAPGVDVTQGSATIDTSRYSAVVALDGAAAPYANRILGFARTGGGVVLGAQAASLEAMAPLRAGAVGHETSDARAIQSGGSVTLATLPLAPITALRSDAVSLEKRAGATAVAVKRIDAGRVLQVGYEDTWRWRMGGGDGAILDQRRWWTGLVSSAAYATRIPRATTATATNEAPIVGLVAAIGSSRTGAASNLSGQPSDWTPSLFALVALALIGEITSRRVRAAS